MIILKNFYEQIQKTLLLILLIQFIFIYSSYPQNDGEKIFLSVCSACHTIGQGKLVGPDLKNIQNRLEKDWIIKWVKSSQKMVKNGDPAAVKIFNEYNKIPMPDNALTDAQIIDVLNYIKEKSPKETNTREVKNLVESETRSFEIKNNFGFNLEDAGKDEFELGLQYFTGKTRFKNGGTACLSCHNVVNDNLIGGGLLGKDLTNAFSRLNAAGIDAIISNPTFPVMKTAFANRKLTRNERYYLLAFLKQTDYDFVYQSQVNYSKYFIYTGIVGVVILLGIFGLIWFKRKKISVKQDIFARQLKSE